MSNPVPLQGNQYYTAISNTIVNPSAVAVAEGKVSQAIIKIANGTFTPTAAGNYSVNDVNGNTLIIPSGSLITQVFYSSTVPLVGGTSVEASVALTAGGAGVTNLTAAVLTATVNAPVGPTATTISNTPYSTATPSTAGCYLSATTVGTFTSGTCQVKVLYI